MRVTRFPQTSELSSSSTDTLPPAVRVHPTDGSCAVTPVSCTSRLLDTSTREGSVLALVCTGSWVLYDVGHDGNFTTWKHVSANLGVTLPQIHVSSTWVLEGTWEVFHTHAPVQSELHKSQPRERKTVPVGTILSSKTDSEFYLRQEQTSRAEDRRGAEGMCKQRRAHRRNG